MEQLDWQLLDEATFRDFCNALLLLEVSKSFVPFSAPGKDKGIDGFYKGSYNNRAGDWRFQYKYHNQSRKQNVSAVKIDLKQEIQKIANESCFVLLTNVELLPQQRDELLLLAEVELKKTDKREIFIDIWDGAKLNALLRNTKYFISGYRKDIGRPNS